ncbi:extensin family protein [Microbaculum marinum]|uniref:Extensin family protein n=1 Tax=Microbaculum marinum TaxID=1764581 RepID=A0AAW9RNK7_9HYPH
MTHSGQRTVAILLVGALLFVFSGCANRSLYSWRDQAWRKDAEAICMGKGGYESSAFVERMRRINDKGACGIWYPLKVSGALQGYVAYSTPAVVNCPMTAAVDGWFYHVVQPAAARIYGAYVTKVQVMASYSCRTRNSKAYAKVSEHSFGNALDIGAFTLSDGRTVTVQHGWRGSAADRAFLREAHSGACKLFTTVIGPDGDSHHYNHFHLDLARHNEDGSYHYCK